MPRLQNYIKQLCKKDWFYNPRESPEAYSVFYSKLVNKYLYYRRGLLKMNTRDVLLSKQGAIQVCSLLNK